MSDGRALDLKDWPLGHRDAHDVATDLASSFDDYPEVRRVFFRRLSGRLIGAADRAELLRRLDEVSAEVRALLPEASS